MSGPGGPTGVPGEAIQRCGGSSRCFHQLLVYVPPAGAGTPFVMGHYGGVVAADGY